MKICFVFRVKKANQYGLLFFCRVCLQLRLTMFFRQEGAYCLRHLIWKNA